MEVSLLMRNILSMKLPVVLPLSR